MRSLAWSAHGSIGAFISPAGVSPFVLVGRLAQLNQLDLEFVCPRCQGMHAESSLITFCPTCGDQRNESALRACQRCKFDFRSLASTKDLWDDPIPVAPPVPQSLPGAQWAPPDPTQQVPTSAAPPFGWQPPAQPQPWQPPLPPPAPVGAPTQVQPSWAPPQVAQRFGATTGVQSSTVSAAATMVAPGGPAPAEPAAMPQWQSLNPTQWQPPQAAARVTIPAGWNADPLARHELRWWDGSTWTAHVLDQGNPGHDTI